MTRLTRGTRLGPYEIAIPLGAGGMGEVYRARDTRLGREVALKVLPAHLTQDREARARFEREARTVSSLNHPHICTLFDIGSEGDTDYLVMELMEGETLAARLARGALATGDALRIGAEIAGALDRAHRAGVVHRDLKPANIMLTRSGAKLMDFGLARMDASPVRAGGAPADPLTQAPTVEQSLTVDGTLLGTLRYMAPEQLEGKRADARSDLWALGCVLYEMATGKRAFEGESGASLIASIMGIEPTPIDQLAPTVPPGLARTVAQCLDKDPERRWQTAGDLGRELLWIAEDVSRGKTPPPATTGGAGRSRHAWWLAAILVVAAGLAVAWAMRAGPRTMPRPEFTAVTYRRMAVFKAAFGPDDRTIVFSAATEGNTPRLYVIRPEAPEARAVGDPMTHLLSVSSRGELAVLTGAAFLGFRLFEGTLARMPLGGAAPREILEKVRQADWAPDGSQLAIIREVAGKDRLEFPVGHPLYESSGYLSDLRFSPHGDRIAFFEHPSRGDDRGSLNLVDLRGRNSVLSDGYQSEEGIAWNRDGREILFSATISGGGLTVYAITPGGKPHVAGSSAGGLTIHDVSRAGRWLASRDDQLYQVMVHTPAWQGDRNLSWLSTSLDPFLSEDRQTLVFDEQSAMAGSNYTVCLRKTDGGDVARLGEGAALALSPDGTRVLAALSSPPQLVIYPTGPGEPVRLERGRTENFGANGSWFPSGDSVLFSANEPGRGARLWVQQVSGGAPRAVTPEGIYDGALSRDGTFILVEDHNDRLRIYALSGGEPHMASSVRHEDRMIRVGTDGRSVLVYRPSEVPVRVERVELETGRRSVVTELAPEERSGLVDIGAIFLSDDERSHAYVAHWLNSTLFTVDWKD